VKLLCWCRILIYQFMWRMLNQLLWRLTLILLRLRSKNGTPILLGNSLPVLGMKIKLRNFFRLFFEKGLWSGRLSKRARRELSIGVAEHRPMLKKKSEIRYISILSSLPKQVYHSLKRLFCFYCVARWRKSELRVRNFNFRKWLPVHLQHNRDCWGL